MYAGVRYAKGCHPSELLTEVGYHTSSNTIKLIIAAEGIGAFIVRGIKEFSTAPQAHDYETRFLQKVHARNNPKFYNHHNNTTIYPFLGTAEYKDVLEERYGVRNPSYNPCVIEKIAQTKLKRYGTRGYNNSALSQENKRKRGSLERQAAMISGERNMSYGKKWYTNGKKNYYLLPEECIPEGYIPGMTAEFPDRAGANNQAYGKKWFTNGIENVYLRPDDNVPYGFIAGLTKLKVVDKTGKNNPNFEKKWFTNGQQNVMLSQNTPIPEGYVLGQTKQRVACPHCGLEGNKGGTMTRYHMDNCKQRKLHE